MGHFGWRQEPLDDFGVIQASTWLDQNVRARRESEKLIRRSRRYFTIEGIFALLSDHYAREMPLIIEETPKIMAHSELQEISRKAGRITATTVILALSEMEGFGIVALDRVSDTPSLILGNHVLYRRAYYLIDDDGPYGETTAGVPDPSLSLDPTPKERQGI